MTRTEAIFMLGAFGLLLLVLLVLARALLNGMAQQGGNRREQNLATARRNLGLLRRDLSFGAIDESQVNELRADIEAQAVHDTENEEPVNAQKRGSLPLAIVLALIVPLFASGIYLHLGQPSLVSRPDIGQMIASLEQALADNPNDVNGWRLLAKTQASRGQHAQASAAMTQLRKLEGDTADNLADHAELLLRQASGNFEGEPMRLLAEALDIDPNHVKALVLSGYASAQAGQVDAARNHWLKALEMGDASLRELLKGEIASLGGTNGVGVGSVEVIIHMDATLLEQVSPDSVLFVFAREPGATAAPLAAKRLQPSTWPVSLRLTDADAMLQAAKLSTSKEVDVVARISQQGRPEASSGDLQGAVTGIATVGGQATLTINSVLP